MQHVIKLTEIANELDAQLAALSIAWCIKNRNVTTAILGATKNEQLLDGHIWVRFRVEI